MRYKIIHIGKKSPTTAASKRLMRRARSSRAKERGAALPALCGVSLPDTQERELPPSDISDLFGFGGFYDPYSETKKKPSRKSGVRYRKTARARAIAWRLRWAFKRQKETVVSKIAAARERRVARAERASKIPILCGAFCAVLCLFALCISVIGYRMLLKDRVLRFEKVTIPDLLGQRYEDGELDESFFDVTLNYEYDASTIHGTVIEQMPSPGVIRRVYRGGEPCRVTLTLSLGKRQLVMRDYIAYSARDAVLDLKNESVKFEIKEEYSETVEVGHVISTDPAPGEDFSSDEVVTLTISLGKERKFVAIPDLFGLTEVRAREVLRTLGFEVGEVRYVASQSASGTVISQSSPAYSLLELGARVDLNVSAGMGFSQKTVPDLYGLTVEEARIKLAEVGLVCGRVYNVQNAAGKLTVVSQSIAAGTPIRSGIVSIDIYISS